jgi:hypothetical protein
MKCSSSLSKVYGNCSRNATVEREGKWFCWQHDPERLERIREAEWEIRRAARSAEETARDVRWTREQLERKSGIRDLTNPELEQIIQEGGIRAILDKLS